MNVTLKIVTAMPTLMHWRREVIATVFGVEPSKRLLVANRQYYRQHIADGTHIAIVAENEDGDGMGCGALCLGDELPSPDNPSGRCAYLMNIYVRAPFRGRGVGGIIVGRLVEIAREKGCDKIYLETTDMARPLYKRTGFEELPGMMKYADIQNSES